MKTFSIAELAPLRILGRTSLLPDGSLPLFWTASGIELSIRAPQLILRCRAGFTLFEPWLDVVIDGVRTQRRMLQAGEQELCIYRSVRLEEGEQPPVRHVQILRDTPSMPEDEENFLQLLSLSFEGELLPLPEPSLRLEFIGDSLTSGEGCCGAPEHMEWDSGCFDAVDNYTFLTVRKLGARAHVLSQSGWGVYCSYLGEVACSLPPYYHQVCGLRKGPLAERLGAQKSWDFSRYQPDAIIVNLGTNDVGSFSKDTRELLARQGKEAPMVLAEDGSMREDCLEKITDAVFGFLGTLRRYNPHAQIIWAYGLLLQDSDILNGQMQLALSRTIARYQKETGDRAVSYLQLPPTLPGEFGARLHPGLKAHQKAADALCARLEELFS